MTNELGEPQAGVFISAQGSSMNLGHNTSAHMPLQTGPDGRFDVRKMHPGRWNLSGRVMTQDAYLQASRSATFDLEPGEARRDMRFAVFSGKVIQGKVVNEAGAPVPGATVSLDLQDVEGGRTSQRQVTDAEGGFRFDSLPPRLSMVWGSVAAVGYEGTNFYQLNGPVTVTLRSLHRRNPPTAASP